MGAAVIAVVLSSTAFNGYDAEKIFQFWRPNVFILNKSSPVVLNPAQFLEGQKAQNLRMEDYQAVLESRARHCEVVGAAEQHLNGT